MNLLRSRRHQVQLGVLMLTLFIGLQFYLFVHQVAGGHAVTVARPAGVEGFLPIGALMAWKRFVVSGEWDVVHPAAMALLGFAALTSFLFRKSFCSWFCPVGTVAEWLWRAGQAVFGKNMRAPRFIDIGLRGVKYLLLGFFVWIIYSMSAVQIEAFLKSPYYIVSDVKMLHFFTRISPTTAIVLSVLTAGSVLIKNFWCRYACPYGALMGLLALVGPTRIERDAAGCTGCKRCSRVCPSRIDIHARKRVLSPECMGCMDCTLACPEPGTLAMKTACLSGKSWSRAGFALAVVVLFSLSVMGARLSGYWHSRVPMPMLRAAMHQMEEGGVTHPSVRFYREEKKGAES